MLHLLRTLDPENGGPVSYLQVAARASAIAGIESSAAAFSGRHPPPADVKLACSGQAGGRLMQWLEKNIARYDVVHLHGMFSWPVFAGSAVARRHRVPFVVSTHGHLYPWSLSRRKLTKGAYLNLYALRRLRQASAVVTTCEREAAIVGRLGKGARVEIVPPSLNVPAHPDADIHHQAESTGELRIVFLGRLAPQKGVPTLLRALAHLPEARLDVLGSGAPDFTRQLQELATELGVSERVHWRGFLHGADRDAVMRHNHVYALPSYMENFSFSTAEALALGLPAVVSDQVALSDVVQRWNCGRVIPAENPEALSEALAAYADPERRRMEGARAHRCALEEFSFSRMARSLEQLYSEAATRRR